MPNPITESESLTRFTSDPEPFLERLRQSGEPLVLVLEGKAQVVVQDAESYRRMLEAVDRLEAIAGIKKGLNDMGAGRTRPIREVLNELAAKHRLPPVQDE